MTAVHGGALGQKGDEGKKSGIQKHYGASASNNVSALLGSYNKGATLTNQAGVEEAGCRGLFLQKI